MVDMEYHSKIHKIIFVGSIHGKFSKLFKKIHKINQEHGPFEAMICPGRVFGVNNEEWQLILSGQLICPIPLFILGPQNSQDQDYYQNNPSPSLAGLIAPNIYCLGSNGIYVTSSDIQIAFISLSCLPDGSWGIHPENVNYITEYLKNSTNFKGVDFLISPVWPAKVVNYVNPTEIPKQFISENGEINVNFGDETISKLASVLQPRYHICQFDSDESIYYQRPPYRNHGNLQTFQKPHHLTHFVSVGAFENSQKFKDTYAVKISPITQMCYSDLCIAPPDTTQNPYPKYMSIIESNQSHSALNKKSLAGLQNKSASLTVSDCWFCLDNPKIQLHMIFYISQFNYITLAKGGLIPQHILLCPISHITCLAALDENTYTEMQALKKTIRKMFKSEEKSVVIFDRNYHSQHLQLQIIPIPKQNPIYLADVFIKHGKKHGMDFTEIRGVEPLSSIISPETPYFYIEFDDGTRLIHLIKGKIPIQFGREVLASPEVLSLRPDRVDWKKCELSVYKETSQAQQLGEKFKHYL